MAIKTLICGNKINQPAVSIQMKKKRLMINKMAWALLVKQNGSESDYIEILVDDSEGKNNAFWVRLCDQESLGSRKLDKSSPSTRTCNISDLISALDLDISTTTRYGMEVDKTQKAAKVDVAKPLSGLEGK